MIYFTSRAKFAASRTPCKAHFQLQIALAFAVTLIPRCRIPKAAALGIKDRGQAAEHLSRYLDVSNEKANYLILSTKDRGGRLCHRC